MSSLQVRPIEVERLLCATTTFSRATENSENEIILETAVEREKDVQHIDVHISRGRCCIIALAAPPTIPRELPYRPSMPHHVGWHD